MRKNRSAGLDRNGIPNITSTDAWIRPERRKTRKTRVYFEVIVPFLRRRIKMERKEAAGSRALRMSLCQYNLEILSYTFFRSNVSENEDEQGKGYIPPKSPQCGSIT